jgi:hypothetical protein
MQDGEHREFWFCWSAGLEAIVVLLWGIEYAPTDIARELLYVALSRARSRVWIVGDQVRARATLR